MKKILFLLLLTTSIVVGYLMLGKWLDMTQKPVKSDIIVSLGGGDWHRYSKAVALYEKGYAQKGILLLTGADVTPEMRREGIPDGRITDLKTYHPEIDYLYLPQLSSTREEVKYIKSYMQKNRYRSALIVTDPPHSRRFSILDNLIGESDAEPLRFHFVSSGVTWWDKKRYYDNQTARKYALTELLKIPYNIMYLLIGEKLSKGKR
jgi:uncharacterized SAM-binding protein YcdF (DUF218 family)